MKIRPTRSLDVPALKRIIEGTDLFPAEMLPDMLKGFLSKEGREELWLSCEEEGAAIGFCYAALEPLTESTWNMLAIAVLPQRQSSGVGKALVKHLEDALRDRGCRVLIVDTSGVDGFAGTRAFYCRNGYVEEARIRDFWAAGDDKVVFWKAL